MATPSTSLSSSSSSSPVRAKRGRDGEDGDAIRLELAATTPPTTTSHEEPVVEKHVITYEDPYSRTLPPNDLKRGDYIDVLTQPNASKDQPELYIFLSLSLSLSLSLFLSI